MFYTSLPLPGWPLNFTRIARWSPLVGVLLGALLGLIDTGLGLLSMPLLPRSALIVALWVGLTGGLHLDGAMDTADGLAVMDPERRLEVMADSRSGAFGGMVAAVLLLLKTCALSAVVTHRPLVLVLATVWGRWGQLVAIAAYPYLKPEGKGACHRQHLQLPWDLFPGLTILLGLAGLQASLQSVAQAAATLAIASFCAWGTGAWFARQLQGMTGDVYGAIVEWTEALLLCVLTVPFL